MQYVVRDAAGDMRADAVGNSYSWDAEGHLKSFVSGGEEKYDSPARSKLLMRMNQPWRRFMPFP